MFAINHGINDNWLKWSWIFSFLHSLCTIWMMWLISIAMLTIWLSILMSKSSHSNCPHHDIHYCANYSLHDFVFVSVTSQSATVRRHIVIYETICCVITAMHTSGPLNRLRRRLTSLSDHFLSTLSIWYVYGDNTLPQNKGGMTIIMLL